MDDIDKRIEAMLNQRRLPSLFFTGVMCVMIGTALAAVLLELSAAVILWVML